MTEKEKMIAGHSFNTMDSELIALRERARMLTMEYNQTLPTEANRRQEILHELFGSRSDQIFIEPSFQCDYGFNIHAKGLLVVNFNCVFLDVGEIRIGNNVFIGPGTCIATACHPIDPVERIKVDSIYGDAVTIGDNVWIGANCTILPGVTIGDNAVIGAGSVVSKDIPHSVVAVGNPCKVIRKV